MRHVNEHLNTDCPTFIDIDIDVLNPEMVPGVSSPSHGGISPQTLIRLIRMLSHRKICGFGICEYNPLRDVNSNTLKACKQIIRGILDCCKDNALKGFAGESTKIFQKRVAIGKPALKEGVVFASTPSKYFVADPERVLDLISNQEKKIHQQKIPFMLELNQVAFKLMQLLNGTLDPLEIAKILSENYDIGQKEALKDVLHFLGELKRGLIKGG